jgi:hypothetical protein
MLEPSRDDRHPHRFPRPEPQGGYTQALAVEGASKLGDHRPALTVIIADIYDSQWLLEIEAIAAL